MILQKAAVLQYRECAMANGRLECGWIAVHRTLQTERRWRGPNDSSSAGQSSSSAIFGALGALFFQSCRCYWSKEVTRDLESVMEARQAPAFWTCPLFAIEACTDSREVTFISNKHCVWWRDSGIGASHGDRAVWRWIWFAISRFVPAWRESDRRSTIPTAITVYDVVFIAETTSSSAPSTEPITSDNIVGSRNPWQSVSRTKSVEQSWGPPYSICQ